MQLTPTHPPHEGTAPNSMQAPARYQLFAGL